MKPMPVMTRILVTARGISDDTVIGDDTDISDDTDIGDGWHGYQSRHG